MRQIHPGGERLFVDYAGPTIPVVDARTGEIRRAQIFVAVLGASNYTYACATWRQTAADWVGAIIATLEFIGGGGSESQAGRPAGTWVRGADGGVSTHAAPWA